MERYYVEVNTKNEFVVVTPHARGDGAVITIDGKGVADNAPSEHIPLAVNTVTDIAIVVKSQDGKTTKPYPLRVVRLQASKVDQLSGLTCKLDGNNPNNCNLSPPFHKTILSYNAVVPAGKKQISVNPAALAPIDTKLEVDTKPVDSGKDSEKVDISKDDAAVDVLTLVAAQDLATKATYKVHVTKWASKPDPKVASLSDLTATAGKFEPAFSSGAPA